MKQPYVRDESAVLKGLYKSYVAVGPTPADVGALCDAIARRTRLPRLADEYPVAGRDLAAAAAALVSAAAELYAEDAGGGDDDPVNSPPAHGLPAIEVPSQRVRTARASAPDLSNPDPAALDEFISAHVIDSALRPYFSGGKVRGDLTPDESQDYNDALTEVRAIREPLLSYALGAFWGEWLVRHRKAVWALEPPLDPIQYFPDMATALYTVCLHPFSQVNKTLCDPEGEKLAVKCDMVLLRPHVPPYPMVASMADAEHAARRLLGPAAAEALESRERHGAASVERFTRALDARPADPRLLALAGAAAWNAGKKDLAERWFQKAVSLYPDFPTANHNLAALIAADRGRRAQAVPLLRRAIAVDPHYSRAKLTLATILSALGEWAEARAIATWVRDHDPELRDEAGKSLYRMTANERKGT